MEIKLKHYLLWVFFIPTFLNAQSIINAYASVTNVSGTTLTIADINTTYDDFLVGEDIIVMQMQDDVIGANTGSNSSFGNISSIGNAGLYEKATIATITPGGTVTETIWEETFEDLADANISDDGTTGWFRYCNAGGTACYQGAAGRTFEVHNTNPITGTFSFAGTNLDSDAVWRSGPIDITGYSNINITADLAEVSYNQNGDYVRVYVSVDEGNFQELSYTVTPQNNFNASVASNGFTVSGSQIEVAVLMNNSRDIEYGIVDNILVEGDRSFSTLTIESALTNTYSTGANSSVQIISYPEFTNYSTASSLTALDWNGKIGGVLAMEVTNTLTLNHNINLDGKGFRGGSLNPFNETTPRNCNPEVYRTSNREYGRKGEGIHKNTIYGYVGARGRLASGGGGGNRHNSGAGGGGNFTAGGNGGPGYNEGNPPAGCDDAAGDPGTGAAGYGGSDLSYHISANRIFMGGGGGGGQHDDVITGDSEPGGDGGGIIIIKADEVLVPCGSGVMITTNGEGFPYPAVDAGWEGGPGAGSGGSILFQVETWTLTCSLQTEAKGGEGATATYTYAHGGGGGGGKGVTIFSGSVPASNYTSDNSQGQGGSNGTDPSAGNADDGDTTPDNPEYQGLPEDAVIQDDEGPLPVTLIYWQGFSKDGFNLLQWSTANEINNDYFTIERSINGIDWSIIAEVSGSGTVSEQSDYQHKDYLNYSGSVYYRLSQTDYDGEREVFDIIYLEIEQITPSVLIYPNPTSGIFSIDLGSNEPNTKVEVYDGSGCRVEVRINSEGQQLKFDMTNHPEGNYLLKIIQGDRVQQFRIALR